MNLSDLIVVAGLGSGVYAIIVALTGQRQFLLRAVNPYRTTWLIAAASVIWVGLSLMRWEAGSWDLAIWGGLFSQLVTDGPTPTRVKAASLALMFGLLQLALVGWCVTRLPRDPGTFHRPRDRRAAFRYYVSRLRGGLDFALLALGDGETVESEMNERQVREWCEHVPKVQPAEGTARTRTAEEQAAFWRQLAADIHARMADLDALVDAAHQGRNRRLVFDTEYGGIYFKYLRVRDPRDKVDTSVYLFAATLSQTEVSAGRAEEHFGLLVEALRNIDRGVRLN